MLGVVRLDLLMPDVATMVNLARTNHGFFLEAWWSTFVVSAAASVTALFFSLAMAVLTLRFAVADFALGPVVAISQSFPLQAIAPLVVIVLGGGFQTKLAVAFIIAFFPIFNACRGALRMTPRSLLALSATCDAGFLRETLFIRLPDALPAVAAAAKVGFTLAVLGAVVAEFISPESGLGRILLVAQANYNVEVIYLAVACLVTQGLAVYGGLSAIESYLLKRRGQ